MVKLIVNARGALASFASLLRAVANDIEQGHRSNKGVGWSFSIQDVKSRRKVK